MTENPEAEGQPIIRDKRRLDPDTGEVRDAEADPVVGQEPDDGAAAAPDAPAEAGEPDELTAAQAEAADLADQLARAKADVYNLDQRFNAYVRRSRTEVADAVVRGHGEVVEALIGVLDDIELARQHGELTGPFASIAEKLENVLSTSFGMERYGEAGEEFDPQVHEALMHNESTEVSSDQVQQVLQPGYKVGERVLRAARVAVVGPA